MLVTDYSKYHIPDAHYCTSGPIYPAPAQNKNTFSIAFHAQTKSVSMF